MAPEPGVAMPPNQTSLGPNAQMASVSVSGEVTAVQRPPAKWRTFWLMPPIQASSRPTPAIPCHQVPLGSGSYQHHPLVSQTDPGAKLAPGETNGNGEEVAPIGTTGAALVLPFSPAPPAWRTLLGADAACCPRPHATPNTTPNPSTIPDRFNIIRPPIQPRTPRTFQGPSRDDLARQRRAPSARSDCEI